MGKTYTQSKKFDEDVSGRRTGKHASGKKPHGMKTLNSYVEEDYEDPFEDDLEIHDEVFIQHTKS